jgi:hypothetical protein
MTRQPNPPPGRRPVRARVGVGHAGAGDVAATELRRIRVDYLTGYESVERAEAMRQSAERDQALEANRHGRRPVAD